MYHVPYTPLELILQILEASLPPGGPGRVFNPSCPDGQLLIAWTQVCRATYQPATSLLRQHFLYIDSLTRLRNFLQCVADSDTLKQSTLPPTIPLSSISSMYLGLDRADMESPQIASLVGDLFQHLSQSLRRLILDLPWGRTPPNDMVNTQLNHMFSGSFASLTGIEELIAVGGLPAVDRWSHVHHLCQQWSNLRRLAAFQQLVISQPFLLRLNTWNIKASIREHWDPEFGGSSTYARPLSITIANHEFSPPIIDTSDDAIHDPQGLINVSSLDVPITDTTKARADYMCRDWLLEEAKQDTLWGDAGAESRRVT
ncbi:hypothetical protein LCI18_010866 [Fusarium solani-melongenae]|uniref:Uncharacterized protein n=1 Tax=Fusarium solani subsp. cucurbitae TaxID=2747967 RepID=A0ACD3ZFN2_FUSSC|nr:hypothetical protein LCI18_010866 [Fusarium solani-melongenae]